ncbi:hypothetical protein HN604_03980 [archaeon]|jgi:hypothetical protein|nr:hypothetical protein [archaeon]MBT6182866.1 hypothetical protein [archaeon]MBT6606731.1 hypothetical protein [archaeon]MBT7251289.1 hypothetical protein [archaeon]MBT7661209.1 hypothetical protein [archaeon]
MDDKKLTSSEKIISKKRAELGNQKEVLKINNPQNEELGIFKRIGMIFSHPKDFFNIVKEEEGIKKPFSIYLYLLLVYVVFGLIMMSMMMFQVVRDMVPQICLLQGLVLDL